MTNKKILQINSVSNYGSTGKIMKGIAKAITDNGWQSFISYGRDLGKPDENHIHIGNKKDNYVHLAMTRLTDLHGRFSNKSTKNFINKIEEIHPDIIHLHNLHGYYLNYPTLFSYIKRENIPLVWTLHDCWTFTGHCAHFEYVGCEKWRSKCHDCVQTNKYPKSFYDNSLKNFIHKKEIFTKLNEDKVIIIPVSNWLADHLANSFLSKYNVEIIKNGIDLSTFKIIKNNNEVLKKYNLQNRSYVIAVASVWEERKGLAHLFDISKILPDNIQLVIVGLNKKQLMLLPKNIIGIERTDNAEELVALYNGAFVLANPTLEDTYPTTNLEALACGVPVITYNTGGSPESIDENTGKVIERKDFKAMTQEIINYSRINKAEVQNLCRKRAEIYFDQNINFKKYIDVYKRLLNL